ncbi:MAG: tRNA (adenosine(37)-N6)-threonylcarbamoyltransferase complex ATPase subunit type 1 TsaE [Actinomycetota bacterium]|nr:tRNA (adenosine(37)-N6)-threonylcarbamoyltransferase complex ATPase subunit type 1 TsaE [Actinomycetota bacterium]
MSIELSECGAEAAAEVHALARAAFAGNGVLDPPTGALRDSVAEVRADLAAYGGVLAHTDGRLVGALRRRPEGDRLWLRRVAVSAAYQRRGLGAALMRWAVERARERGFAEVAVRVRHVLPGNHAFYRALGFTAVGERDAWVELTLPLSGAVVLDTAEQTQAYGARMAAALAPGDLVVLSGSLGAGKTVLVQGIARGLGINDTVTSPTFVLARVYGGGRIPLVHVDAYRLGSGAAARLAVDDLDLDADAAESVTVVEWGSGVVEGLAEARLEVHLERLDDDRRVLVTRLVRREGAGEPLNDLSKLETSR